MSYAFAMDIQLKLPAAVYVVVGIQTICFIAWAQPQITDNREQHVGAGSLLNNWRDFCQLGHCSAADHKFLLQTKVPELLLQVSDSIPPEDDADKECRLAIERYAVHAANFTYCTVKFARPITFCEQCIEYHDRAEHEMNILKSLSNSHKSKNNSSRSCHDIMTNSDRIHLLEQSDQFLSSVWEESNCDRCFHNHSIDAVTEQFTFTYSVDLSLFQKLHTEATECFRQFGADFVIKNDSTHANRSAACVQCADEYNRLNKYYVDVEHAAELSGLCMDMVDLMNYTRQTWSTKFLCKSQRANDPALLAVSLFLTLFVLTFYISSKIQSGFEAYKIRKQQRLTQQQIEENAAAASAVAASAVPRTVSRSTSYQPRDLHLSNNVAGNSRYSRPAPIASRPNPAGFDVFGHSYDAFGSYASESMHDASSVSTSALGNSNRFLGNSYGITARNVDDE